MFGRFRGRRGRAGRRFHGRRFARRSFRRRSRFKVRHRSTLSGMRVGTRM